MIVFCRIDDRLIHGQVVTTWVNVKKYRINNCCKRQGCK